LTRRDRRIVPHESHSIAAPPAASRSAQTAVSLDGWDELFEMIESFDGSREHLHQFLALFRHVSSKHLLQRRIDFEQPPVEQCRHIVGDRSDRGKGFLDERLLGQRQHLVRP